MRIASAVLLATIFAFGCVGCSFSVKNVDAVDGTAVQHKIDETITPYFKSLLPTLKIAPSQCEPIIQVAQGTMGSCTLSINDVPIEVRVASAGPPDNFKVDLDGQFFFDMSYDEKLIHNSLLNDYTVPVRGEVNCGKPRERLLRPGTSFTCAISGTPLVHSIRIKVAPNGQAFIPYIAGLKVASALPNSLLTLHKQGKPVFVSGADVENDIRKAWSSEPSRQIAGITIACPAQMDLTGSKRGVCEATIPGVTRALRLGFWIEPVVGFSIRPIDAVVDRSKVQQMAQVDLNKRLADNGNVADAVVVCEKGLIVVTPPATFNCKATANGKHYRLVVYVQDWKGTVTWRGISLD